MAGQQRRGSPGRAPRRRRARARPSWRGQRRGDGRPLRGPGSAPRRRRRRCRRSACRPWPPRCRRRCRGTATPERRGEQRGRRWTCRRPAARPARTDRPRRHRIEPQRVEVALDVAAGLGDRVAAELLQRPRRRAPARPSPRRRRRRPAPRRRRSAGCGRPPPRRWRRRRWAARGAPSRSASSRRAPAAARRWSCRPRCRRRGPTCAGRPSSVRHDLVVGQRAAGGPARSKPSPTSTPLIAWMPMSAAASRASSRRSQCTWLPRPGGRP